MGALSKSTFYGEPVKLGDSGSGKIKDLSREMLNKSAFYGKPAWLCDAGINKINALARDLAAKVSAFI